MVARYRRYKHELSCPSRTASSRAPCVRARARSLHTTTDIPLLALHMHQHEQGTKSLPRQLRHRMAPWGVSTLAAWPLPISPSVLGPQVEAKKAVPKEEHPGRAQGGSGLPSGRTRKVFVGGLAPSVDEAALRQYFEQFGPVDDAVVMHDHESRRPRGFGFVTFVNEETVDDVLNAGPLQVSPRRSVPACCKFKNCIVQKIVLQSAPSGETPSFSSSIQHAMRSHRHVSQPVSCIALNTKHRNNLVLPDRLLCGCIDVLCCLRLHRRCTTSRSRSKRRCRGTRCRRRGGCRLAAAAARPRTWRTAAAPPTAATQPPTLRF